MIGVAALVLAILAFAWWRRTKRDAAPLAPTGDLPAGSVVHSSFGGFYVATTRHDEPLERIAAPGLAFRARVVAHIADTGLALDIAGAERIVLTADRLVAVEQSTVAIDRVVEKDGLARVVWRTLTDTVVDTYLRPSDASAKALADAIRPLTAGSTPSAPTGTDA